MVMVRMDQCVFNFSETNLLKIAFDDDDLGTESGSFHAPDFAQESFPTARDCAEKVIQRLALDCELHIALERIVAGSERSHLSPYEMRRERPGTFFASVDDDVDHCLEWGSLDRCCVVQKRVDHLAASGTTNKWIGRCAISIPAVECRLRCCP